ncbi:hypothetical protein [Nitratidesulfovibrio vulgaris]|uniref:hypothetical protein n=1 Tax=Nitratidesulfovibrio vulgaris TaxID=881 RepID=UPI002301A02E|nr:hypothetical protein [Nitratidesulfovibrio vulgaris]WCB45066.1 hypothetical protein PH214_08145 [Nitratidesulfovibrio vulgaris]
MIKFRALPITILRTVPETLNILNQLKYNNDTGRGVSVSETTDNRICGTYYEEKSYIEIVNHPIHGRIETQQSLLQSIDYYLDIRNSISIFTGNTRNISLFMNFISIEAPRLLFIKESCIKLNDALSFFRRNIQECLISKISFHEFQISESSKATITITSKGDAYSDSSIFNVDAELHPKAFRVEGRFLDHRLRLSISSTGTFTITSKVEEEFFNYLADHLPDFFN